VLVEDGQITSFAAHLPLSKDLQQTAHMGTRHSAALGLAELCDALCLVVSEERGTVSIARDGRLYTARNAQEIAGAIRTFFETKFPGRQSKGEALQFFRQNWIAKAVSFSLAFGFWYILVPGSKMIRVNYKLPVSIERLPPDLQVHEVQPAEISATFNGPRRAFYLLDAAKIKVTVDGASTELGRRTFSISEQNIRYPKDLTLEELSPSTVRVSIKKISPTAGSKKS
jgi:hypothetical protein